jgi:hypothetical protein
VACHLWDLFLQCVAPQRWSGSELPLTSLNPTPPTNLSAWRGQALLRSHIVLSHIQTGGLDTLAAFCSEGPGVGAGPRKWNLGRDEERGGGWVRGAGLKGGSQ